MDVTYSELSTEDAEALIKLRLSVVPCVNTISSGSALINAAMRSRAC